jgi:hypothetical protein
VLRATVREHSKRQLTPKYSTVTPAPARMVKVWDCLSVRILINFAACASDMTEKNKNKIKKTEKVL